MSENIRDVADMSFREHGVLLLKRCLALPSKMIGFKPVCLYLATWLLWCGKIDGWVWLCVLCAVLFGIVGLKVLGAVRGGFGSFLGGEDSRNRKGNDGEVGG